MIADLLATFFELGVSFWATQGRLGGAPCSEFGHLVIYGLELGAPGRARSIGHCLPMGCVNRSRDRGLALFMELGWRDLDPACPHTGPVLVWESVPRRRKGSSCRAYIW